MNLPDFINLRSLRVATAEWLSPSSYLHRPTSLLPYKFLWRLVVIRDFIDRVSSVGALRFNLRPFGSILSTSLGGESLSVVHSSAFEETGFCGSPVKMLESVREVLPSKTSKRSASAPRPRRPWFPPSFPLPSPTRYPYSPPHVFPDPSGLVLRQFQHQMARVDR